MNTFLIPTFVTPNERDPNICGCCQRHTFRAKQKLVWVHVYPMYTTYELLDECICCGHSKKSH